MLPIKSPSGIHCIKKAEANNTGKMIIRENSVTFKQLCIFSKIITYVFAVFDQALELMYNIGKSPWLQTHIYAHKSLCISITDNCLIIFFTHFEAIIFYRVFLCSTHWYISTFLLSFTALTAMPYCSSLRG